MNARRYRNPARPLFLAALLAITGMSTLLPVERNAMGGGLTESVTESESVLHHTAVRMRWLLTAPHASSRRCCER